MLALVKTVPILDGLSWGRGVDSPARQGGGGDPASAPPHPDPPKVRLITPAQTDGPVVSLPSGQGIACPLHTASSDACGSDCRRDAPLSGRGGPREGPQPFSFPTFSAKAVSKAACLSGPASVWCCAFHWS